MGANAFDRDRARSLFSETQRVGYGALDDVFAPFIGIQAVKELDRYGLLNDHEVVYCDELVSEGLTALRGVHRALNDSIVEVTGAQGNHLQSIEIRVFPPGRFTTEVHRNDPNVGYWAAGAVLQGESPFYIYDQDQLPNGSTIPLTGTDVDPIPLQSYYTRPGSVWSLYTRNEAFPHSGGVVMSPDPRILAVFYGYTSLSPEYRRF